MFCKYCGNSVDLKTMKCTVCGNEVGPLKGGTGFNDGVSNETEGNASEQIDRVVMPRLEQLSVDVRKVQSKVSKRNDRRIMTACAISILISIVALIMSLLIFNSLKHLPESEGVNDTTPSPTETVAVDKNNNDGKKHKIDAQTPTGNGNEEDRRKDPEPSPIVTHDPTYGDDLIPDKDDGRTGDGTPFT